MRFCKINQRPLSPNWIPHEHSKEIAVISRILDENPSITEAAYFDLTDGREIKNGRKGLSAEMVVRCAIIKAIRGCTYRQLEYNLLDSITDRKFCRLEFGHNPKRSALQKNIMKLTPDTWQQIDDILVLYAKEKGIEKGRKIRTDCTVVETNIHHPTDSGLLWDCNRVLIRVLGEMKEGFPNLKIRYTNHGKRAKRRAYEIQYPKKKKNKKKQQKAAYRDLLKVTCKTLSYARKAYDLLKDYEAVTINEHLMKPYYLEKLNEFINSTEQVMEQTYRRVIEGQSVKADEKIFSIFEKHTDIIIKDNRETFFGHKVRLSGGESGMILDCVIENGNPADSTMVEDSIRRLISLYGSPPLQYSFDGGFASKENVKIAKEMGVKDVCFNKKRGLKITDMVKSAWVYERLKNFRAGIEGCISTLKRAYGMNRCPWEGLEAFKSYVWSCIVGYNLIALARHLIA